MNAAVDQQQSPTPQIVEGYSAQAYTDAAQFQAELEKIWRPSWQFFCPVHKLADPGDVVVGWLSGTPVVLARGHDGTIHGFLNVCPHRAHPVAEQSGNCKVLTCRYHAWTFGLDGSFRGAPSVSRREIEDVDSLGLTLVSVDVLGPLVFVNLSKDAVSLRETHPKLEGYLSKIGFPTDESRALEEYELINEIQYDFAANWKLWYDNNTECYHCPTVHQTSFGDTFDIDPSEYEYEEIDRFLAYAFTGSFEQHSVQVYPGIGITTHGDAMLLYQATPVDPNKTSKMLFCLTRRAGDRDAVQDIIKTWDQTFREDKGVVEQQHKIIRSGIAATMRYVPYREPAATFINGMTRRALEDA